MRVAIIGICTDHKGIDAALKEVIEELNEESIVLCEDDISGVGLAVRTTGMKVANKYCGRADMLLGYDKMYEDRRQHILDTADKIYVIWDGIEEFTKATIEKLKTMDKLYKVIMVE